MAPTPTSSSGITTNKATGERHIPSSTRADGSQRREIRVRPGYCPPEDVELYKNRSASAWKNRGKGGVPGAEGLKDVGSTIPGAISSNKNAKKREAKKKAKANEVSRDGAEISNQTGGIMAQDNWRSPSQQPAPSTNKKAAEDEAVDPELEKEKKARNLKKKLKQARELREKKDKGENLLPEQFEKIIRINELVKMLDVLGFDSEGERKQDTKSEASAQHPGE